MNTTIEPTIRQKIQIPYKYSAGPAMTRFLRGLQQKVIYASVCSGCGRRSVPPVGFCGRCWREINDYVAVEQRGTIESVIRSSEGLHQLPASPGIPLTYALIRLPDCSTSLIHLVECTPATPLEAGMVVAPVWKEERTASILDIAYFQRV